MSERDYNTTARKLREDRSRVGVAVFGLYDSGVAGNESDVTGSSCESHQYFSPLLFK